MNMGTNNKIIISLTINDHLIRPPFGMPLECHGMPLGIHWDASRMRRRVFPNIHI